jgi:hypothetical protein
MGFAVARAAIGAATGRPLGRERKTNRPFFATRIPLHRHRGTTLSIQPALVDAVSATPRQIHPFGFPVPFHHETLRGVELCAYRCALCASA